MAEKKYSIRRRLQQIMSLVALIALLVAAVLAAGGMLRIQRVALRDGKELLEYTSGTSREALLDQMEHSLQDVAESKAHLADNMMSRFAGYIDGFVDFTEDLYANPQHYMPREVLPPDKENKGVFSMQRYLERKDMTLADVEEELFLLGNLESVFAPVIQQNQNVITTIYIGTESGFLLSYDPNADLGDSPAQEELFDFKGSSWYTLARDAGRTVFTRTYQDSYGRGLTISCASPIYAPDGSFAAVVCMDILISDINEDIINVDLGENTYAILVDREGNIIASPHMYQDGDRFENILLNQSSPAFEVARELISGESGLALTSDGIYYSYTPVESAGWTLAIHIPAQDIVGPVEEIQSNIAAGSAQTMETLKGNFIATLLLFLVAFAALLLAVVFISGRYAKQLTAPLIQLTGDAREISQGKLDFRTQVRTNDEIGDLATAFNSMTESLQQYITDLTTVTAEKERIGAELGVATQIQASMLPCIFPAFPERSEFDIYATMQPAKEVGGDFYDFFLVDDNHLALVIADVSGKGVPAALFMVIAKTLIKNSAQNGLSPADVLAKVNNQLCENNEAEMFVTVWLGILEISTGTMTCANAGHEYPAICRKGQSYELLMDKHGFVVAGMENMKYKQYEVQLNPGDRLYVYTDGVPEATDTHEELFGTDRMIQALNENPTSEPEELLHRVKQDIDIFVGEAPQFDDITMLGLHYYGPTQQPQD